MKVLIPILIGLLVVGCGKKDDGNTGVVKPNLPLPKAEPEKLITNPIVEEQIRWTLGGATGELTKADLEKVKDLELSANQLTEVPKDLEKLTQLEYLNLPFNRLTALNGLEKLTQLTHLDLRDNPDLTKAQIAELQKALPNCDILSSLPLTKEESAKEIEKEIRKAANKPTGDLTKADYEKVTRLDLTLSQLTSVKGLENLTQLKILILQVNKLTDVKGLEKLTQLTDLVLSDNKLTDVKELEKLTQLSLLYLDDNPDLTKAQIVELQKALPKCKIYSSLPLTKEESAKEIEKEIRKAANKPTGELTEADYEKVTELQLGANQLTDVKGLEKLTQLEKLVLQNNQLTEFPKGLEKLTQLKELLLGSNQLTDVKGLEKLTQLKMLALNNNQLTDVPKGLEKFTKLTGLYLQDNQLTDVKGLEKLDQLSLLELNNNRLTELNGLEKLTQLTWLDLRDNPDLTKGQIAELQKALPECTIHSNPKK